MRTREEEEVAEDVEAEVAKAKDSEAEGGQQFPAGEVQTDPNAA